MNLGLENKSVFVAASSKGLGKAIALEYAREGANVTIASRDMAQLEAARDEIASATGHAPHAVLLDVRNAGDIRSAIRSAAERHGGLDVLVTNAGGPPQGGFEAFDDAGWQSGFELTLLSVVRLIREALPQLRSAADGGRIVNVASMSVKEPIPNLILSNVFRAGVNSLAKSLSLELAPDRILINTVAPGRIGTDRITQLDSQRAERENRTLEQIQQAANAAIPLGRAGTPEEFAKAAVFLGSFANTYITGQSLLVDGGTVRGL
ncbi:SDR family oxidoreductase [Cohnella thailandensis]|uniref:SDR family oxidoreductase n=1 Tax=Cohnella thailandensis TaxID=557557 RepID=A0A841SMY4_9BACL|nr:SDR family oxidoreductase [Cohnella thailandensis]MBB6632532.1 SDR family oxidoreductase [Cohnella thailandensis]MBP1971824.1 3-oxoacyl-[acyl-carrier protein] reductase [Cohnella thailandensis]